jgi:hypothetical protein
MSGDFSRLVDHMASTTTALSDLADHTGDPVTRDLLRELAGLWIDVGAQLISQVRPGAPGAWQRR